MNLSRTSVKLRVIEDVVSLGDPEALHIEMVKPVLVVEQAGDREGDHYEIKVTGIYSVPDTEGHPYDDNPRVESLENVTATIVSSAVDVVEALEASIKPDALFHEWFDPKYVEVSRIGTEESSLKGLIRHDRVEWGLGSRDVSAEVGEMLMEASQEASWDNYSTAARLRDTVRELEIRHSGADTELHRAASRNRPVDVPAPPQEHSASVSRELVDAKKHYDSHHDTPSAQRLIRAYEDAKHHILAEGGNIDSAVRPLYISVAKQLMELRLMREAPGRPNLIARSEGGLER